MIFGFRIPVLERPAICFVEQVVGKPPPPENTRLKECPHAIKGVNRQKSRHARRSFFFRASCVNRFLPGLTPARRSNPVFTGGLPVSSQGYSRILRTPR